MSVNVLYKTSAKATGGRDGQADAGDDDSRVSHGQLLGVSTRHYLLIWLVGKTVRPGHDHPGRLYLRALRR